jgi:pyrophosphatase PpaX
LATITKYAQPVVKKLASKYKLGIVTSRVNRGVSIFFELFGHRSLFDSVVGFEDYKRPKPDPEPIETSLKQLQVKPLEAVYIGDGPSDLKSAKAAGVYFIGYGEKVGNTKHKTSSLKELESVIKSLK